MTDSTDYDFALALQLYEDLNGVKFTAPAEEYVTSDPEDDVPEIKSEFPQFMVKQELQESDMMNRNYLNASTSVVTFDNQQAITVSFLLDCFSRDLDTKLELLQIQAERKTQNDYFMPIINTFINLSNDQEWQEVNISSNIAKMVDCMIEHYFKDSLQKFDFKISWDVNNVISDDSSFKIFQPAKEVLISTALQVYPRACLVSTLFHILIHFHLNSISKDKIKLNVHEESFREIMIFLNDALHIKITVIYFNLKSLQHSFS